jgi:unsaturated chondroitin disaccharide hydrolase
MKYVVSCVILCSIFSAFAQEVVLAENVENAVTFAASQLAKTVSEIDDRSRYPSYCEKDGDWKTTASYRWTSGFFPGCLWLGYELTGEENLKKWAQEWTAGLEKEKTSLREHDLGFMIGCSFGNGYRLLGTESYKPTILTAAKTEGSRYSSVVGCLESSWDRKKITDNFPVVIDIMMNLEIMFWAAENGGESNLRQRAIDHALHNVKDFIRSDNGTYHIVRYNKKSGDIIGKGTLQGYNDESTWSRGHAWAVYGFVTCYRFTKDTTFLNAAVRLADYFIENLNDDYVSKWDFDAPSSKPWRDVSATAVVGSALFELITCLDDPNMVTKYRTTARNILAALCDKPYLALDAGTNAILLHSTHNVPAGSNIDVPCSFADYYFLEMIKRFKEDTIPTVNIRKSGMHIRQEKKAFMPEIRRAFSSPTGFAAQYDIRYDIAGRVVAANPKKISSYCVLLKN